MKKLIILLFLFLFIGCIKSYPTKYTLIKEGFYKTVEYKLATFNDTSKTIITFNDDCIITFNEHLDILSRYVYVYNVDSSSRIDYKILRFEVIKESLK